MLVKIGDTDISKHILTGSYDVNASDVYHEWTDANQVRHHDVVRKRVAGRFSLKFLGESGYAAFVELVKSCKTVENTLPVSLYVVNENEQKETYVFFKMGPKVQRNYKEKTFTSFTFEVTEP